MKKFTSSRSELSVCLFRCQKLFNFVKPFFQGRTVNHSRNPGWMTTSIQFDSHQSTTILSTNFSTNFRSPVRTIYKPQLWSVLPIFPYDVQTSWMSLPNNNTATFITAVHHPKLIRIMILKCHYARHSARWLSKTNSRSLNGSSTSTRRWIRTQDRTSISESLQDSPRTTHWRTNNRSRFSLLLVRLARTTSHTR